MGSHQQLTWTKILMNLGAITALSCVNATSVRAETKSFDFTLSSNGNQTFATLVQQAESLASNSIEQGFAEKSSVTEVSVTIVGEHNGQQVPLLFSKVSRSDWHTEPKIQRWTRYFIKAAALLGLNKPQSQANLPRKSAPTFKPRIEDDPAFRDD
jgi:hypothetical protein